MPLLVNRCYRTPSLDVTLVVDIHMFLNLHPRCVLVCGQVFHHSKRIQVQFILHSLRSPSHGPNHLLSIQGHDLTIRNHLLLDAGLWLNTSNCPPEGFPTISWPWGQWSCHFSPDTSELGMLSRVTVTRASCDVNWQLLQRPTC